MKEMSYMFFGEGEGQKQYEIVDAYARREAARRERDIKILKLAAEGNLYYVDDNNDVAYEKDVPEDALQYATLESFGGNSFVRNQMISEQTVLSGVPGSRNSLVFITTELNKNHVYLVGCNQGTTISWIEDNTFFISGQVTPYEEGEDADVNYNLNSGRRAWVFRPSYSEEHKVGVRCWNPSATVTYSDFALIDLTVWLGADVANTIITAEDAFALGVTKDFIPYDSGTEVNVQVDTIVSVDADGAVVDTKIVPEAVRTLSGYGGKGSTVDTIGLKFIAADDTETDIAAMLPENFYAIEVAPGGSIKFMQNSEEVPAPSSVSYLVRI